MNQADMRYSRVAVGPHPAASPFLPSTRTEFYREEFLKHRRCLELQREFYSERAINEVECVLSRILSQLDQLCCKDDADRLVSVLLKKLDAVTGLSTSGDQKMLH
jgi:hypothetical protein